MRKILIISIGICFLLLTGCGHSSKLTPKLLHLKKTPVSVFDLALVRAQLDIYISLLDAYGRFPVAVVRYKEEKNIINVVVIPWEFTTNKEKAESDDIYFLVENEKELDQYDDAIDRETEYSITQGGIECVVEELIQTGRIDEFEMEAMDKFKKDYNNMELNKLVKFVYEKYPEYTKNSKIKDKVLGAVIEWTRTG